MKEMEIKKVVREGYAEIAKNEGSCSCGCSSDTAQAISQQIGYTDEELTSVPQGANLGLGCGNPTALASLKEGETVLDLGSGAGFDCFLAANKVGTKGKVIGVDMTPEMLEKARKNAENGGYENVEFRLGEIENLPLADNSVDVIISNCVINLSPDKAIVFQETFRVLKPGGRLMVSDITLTKELPEVIQNSVSAYIACISGAMLKEDYLAAIKKAGFHEVKTVDETFFPIDSMTNDTTIKAIVDQVDVPASEIENIADSFVSIKVQGIKPE